MDSGSLRLARIRTLALALAGLSVAVVVVSAYIRLNGAGLGCAAWPECYGQLLSGGPFPHNGAVRILHRVAASAALLLGFVLAWHCRRPEPIRPLAGQAALLLALMILLTMVGIFSADPHRAWAGFFNILGGAALVALSARLALAAGRDAALAGGAPPAALPHAALGLLVLAIALGALIGARYAAVACTSLPACSGVAWPAPGGWGALNPFVTVAAPAAAGDEGGVALHLVHRYLAVATLLLLGLAGLRALARPATRPTAVALLLLLAVQFTLGVLTVLGGFALWLAIAHSVGATLLLAAAMQLLARSRR